MCTALLLVSTIIIVLVLDFKFVFGAGHELAATDVYDNLKIQNHLFIYSIFLVSLATNLRSSINSNSKDHSKNNINTV